MEGFKKLPKMQHFKIGGAVTKKLASIVEKTLPISKISEPKVAKAKSAASSLPKEKEEAVDLSTLKKGGRAKKKEGTVKKFKKDETAAEIKKAKVVKKKEGGRIKKMAEGSQTAPMGTDPAVQTVPVVAADQMNQNAAGAASTQANDYANWQANAQNTLNQPQNAWIGEMNRMNAEHPFPQGVVNRVPGLPPFRIGPENRDAEMAQWKQQHGAPAPQPQPQPQPTNDRWNPARVKGGATAQPTPFPGRQQRGIR